VNSLIYLGSDFRYENWN